jgi:uncharacterized membrane protein
MKYSEKVVRSLVKTFSWRVLMTSSHVVNGIIVTGSMMIAVQIAGLAIVINSILYWLHERAWNRSEWSRRNDLTRAFVEGHPRSVVKVVSWRVVVTSSNFVIPFILTGSWGAAVIFAGLATVVNMTLYWAHERVWNIFSWGRLRNDSVVIA